MSERIFADGLVIKPRPENAPDFVKAKLSFKVDEFTEFLKRNQTNGWTNVDILLSKGGKLYCALNTFKPTPKDDTDSSPF